MNIIFISNVGWFSIIDRKEHFIKRFPLDWQILAISPFKLKENLKSNKNQFKNIKFFKIPFFNNTNYKILAIFFSVKIIRFFIEIIISIWILSIRRKYKNPIIITENIYWANVLKRFNPQKLFFDYYDNFLAFKNTPLWAKEYFEKSIFISDAIFVSSNFLFNQIKQINSSKKVYLIGNGVDTEHFDKNKRYIMPEKLKKVKNKIIGFMGTISNWFDFELIKEIAFQFKEQTILLIGPQSNDVKKEIELLKKFENILILGCIPYQELPAYINFFDLAIIPVKKNLLTDAMNMSKMYIYAAMNKPIVSINLESFSLYKNEINLANNHKEFIDIIKKFLNGQIKQKKLEKIIEENSWNNQVNKIIEIIKNEVEK